MGFFKHIPEEPLQQLAAAGHLEWLRTEAPKGRFYLIGMNGNAYSIMGRMRRALVKAGWSREEVDMYIDWMTEGTYERLLNLAMDVCKEPGTCGICHGRWDECDACGHGLQREPDDDRERPR